MPPVILAVDDKRESRDRLQAELAGGTGVTIES